MPKNINDFYTRYFLDFLESVFIQVVNGIENMATIENIYSQVETSLKQKSPQMEAKMQENKIAFFEKLREIREKKEEIKRLLQAKKSDKNVNDVYNKKMLL